MNLERILSNNPEAKHAISVTAGFAFGMVLAYVFDTPHSSWIPFTVILMNMPTLQGQIVQKTADRIIGTSAGVLFTFFFISIFVYSDYRWSYLVIPVFAVIMYITFVTGNYVLAVISTTMCVIFEQIVISGGSTIYTLEFALSERLFYTLLGIVIALVCEFSFYRLSNSSTRKYKKNTRLYFIGMGELITLISQAFTRKIELNQEIKDKCSQIAGSLSSIEALYIAVKHEYDFTTDNELLSYLSNRMNQLVKKLSILLVIMANEKIDESVMKSDDLMKISDSVADNFRNVIKLIYSDKTQLNIDSDKVLASVAIKNRFTPTCVFIDHLLKTHTIYLDTMKVIREETYLSAEMQ